MKKLLICTALSAILLSGCTFAQKSEGIIKVNNNVITKAQFDKAFDKTIDSSFLSALGGSKNFMKTDDNPMYTMFKNKVVNELIVKSILDEEIAKRGITATKEDIKNELQAVTDKVGSKEELNKTLKQRGVSNDQFMEDLETQIKIKKLVNSIDKINISDADAKKYYDSHKAQFSHGEQVRASHILVTAMPTEIIKSIKEKNPDMNPTDLNKEVDKKLAEQLAKAENILSQVKNNPDDFAKIAQKQSDDKASGERGGELGFFPREAMVKEFAEVAFSMKPNTIFDKPVKSQYGYHIIMVTDRMEAGTTPYEKVKEDIKFYLETTKQIEVLKKFIDASMKNAKIDYLDETYNPSYVKKEMTKEIEEQKTK